jgi:hypothetical protein
MRPVLDSPLAFASQLVLHTANFFLVLDRYIVHQGSVSEMSECRNIRELGRNKPLSPLRQTVSLLHHCFVRFFFPERPQFANVLDVTLV